MDYVIKLGKVKLESLDSDIMPASLDLEGLEIEIKDIDIKEIFKFVTSTLKEIRSIAANTKEGTTFELLDKIFSPQES